MGNVSSHQPAALLVSVRSSRPVPDALARHARHRVVTALGRFARHVRDVRVHLRDANGPRGGVDKRCLVTIRLKRSPRLLVIDDIDAAFTTAIDRAADRAGRAISRVLDATRLWTRRSSEAS